MNGPLFGAAFIESRTQMDDSWKDPTDRGRVGEVVWLPAFQGVSGLGATIGYRVILLVQKRNIHCKANFRRKWRKPVSAA